MPRVRDPQGHKIDVTEEHIASGEPVVCYMCGWRCSLKEAGLSSAKSTQEKPQEPSPEPSGDEPDTEPEE